MSYNLTKVSTKEPDSDGDITLNVADVTSVSSPLDNQVLAYNGTNWIADNLSVIQSNTNVFQSTVATNLGSRNDPSGMLLSYSNLPTGYYRAHFWFRRLGSGFPDVFVETNDETADADLINHQRTSEDLYYKIVFNNAGVYRVFAKLILSDTYGAANSSAEVQWANKDFTTLYGPRYRVQRATENSRPAICVVNATAGQELVLYNIALNGTPNYPMGSSFNDYLIVVEKLE